MHAPAILLILPALNRRFIVSYILAQSNDLLRAGDHVEPEHPVSQAAQGRIEQRGNAYIEARRFSRLEFIEQQVKYVVETLQHNFSRNRILVIPG
jgi:hypothetical protein